MHLQTAHMHRRTCHFSGRVQGVGFRCTVQNIALQYDVRGYVRNLPDGRVELVIEGPDRDLDALMQDVRRRMNGFIREVRFSDESARGEFAQFQIRH